MVRLLSKLLVGALVALTSCKTLKDTRAVDRITASRPLLNKIKPFVDSLYPCKIDTVTKIKLGKRDSFYFNIPIYIDTTDRQAILDSLNNEGVCWEETRLAYDAGFQSAKTKFGNVKLPKPIIDTFIQTVIDLKGLSIANEARIVAENKVASLVATNKKYKQERNTEAIVIAILLVALGALTFLKLK